MFLKQKCHQCTSFVLTDYPSLIQWMFVRNRSWIPWLALLHNSLRVYQFWCFIVKIHWVKIDFFSKQRKLCSAIVIKHWIILEISFSHRIDIIQWMQPKISKQNSTYVKHTLHKVISITTNVWVTTKASLYTSVL